MAVLLGLAILDRYEKGWVAVAAVATAGEARERDRRRETVALRAPIVAGMVLAVAALIAAPLAGSQAILLDGFVSIVHVATGLFTLHMARLIRRGGNDRYPFGYAAFEPLVNLVKSLLMAGVSLFAVWNAVTAIAAGGTMIRLSGAIIYAAVATVVTTVTAVFVRRAARTLGSPLLRGELSARIVDAASAAGLLLAFLVAWALDAAGLGEIAAYADPVVALLLVAATIGVPYILGRDALAELLAIAPPPEYTAPWRHAATASLHGLPVAEVRVWVRALQIGRTWEITVHAHLAPDTDITVRDADDYCHRVRAALDAEAERQGAQAETNHGRHPRRPRYRCATGAPTRREIETR